MSRQKVAVITGVSRGLGLATARRFAAKGWGVVGTGRSKRPPELPKEIEYHQFDASDPAACEVFWRAVQGQYPDAAICLVNNAGGYVYGGLTALKAEDYMQQMNSIYYSAVHMTRGLASVASSARIINVISDTALSPHKDELAYGAAKAAETYFFQSIQQGSKPDKYQITNLYPLSIASHGADPKATDPDDLAEFILQQADSQATYYLRDVTLYPR